MYKEVEVKTDIGNLTVAFTRLDHAHVSTPGDSFVTVWGKEYSASVHLHMANGNWQIKDSRDGGYSSVTKRDWSHYSQSSAAPTIAAKVVEYCREALVQVLTDDPTLPTQAERDSIARDIASLTEDRNSLLRQAGEKFIEIRRLYARRNQLERA